MVMQRVGAAKDYSTAALNNNCAVKSVSAPPFLVKLLPHQNVSQLIQNTA
jgi:hypothetical protein